MKKPMMSAKMAILKRKKYLQHWQKKLHSCHSPTESKRFLGKGSFGSVYLVRRPSSWTKDGFPVEMAVKTAKVDDSSTLRYENEVLSKLTESPYVIRCYGCQETIEVDEYYSGDGVKVYYLLLEYCCGGSLNDHIQKSGNGLLESQVRSYTRDVVRGLVYIHSHAIVHCDIKPHNILLVPGTDHGFVAKLADFGLAKNLFLEDEENSDLRVSLRYMCPEQVRERLLTYTADIWALGCVVVDMMSGKPAWGYGLNKEELLKRIGYSSQMPNIPDNVSDDAVDFLKKCFIRSELFRWSAQELLRHPFLSEEK